MTEADAQNIVVSCVRTPTDIAIVPNCTVFGHESDVLRLTKTRRVYEYEIKLTRADFLRDRRKWIKGMLLRDLDQDSGTYRVSASTPNQFWYAVLAGMATVEDMPMRAGLILINPETNRARVVRRASTIHNDVVSARVEAYLHRGVTLRYWQEREGVNPMREARERMKREQREYRERDQRDQRRLAELQALIATTGAGLHRP